MAADPLTFFGDRVIVHAGDCLEVMQGLSENSIDSIVCDPPYHLASIVKRFGAEDAAEAKSNGATGVYKRASSGFMGQRWDGGDVAFDDRTWARVLRVLKPGGHLVAFGAPKNVHRLTCAIEDGGFEIRDQLSYMFGTGFPKSHSVALDFERQLCENSGGNWRYRDDGVVMARRPPFRSPEASEWYGWGTALKPAIEPIVLARKPVEGTVAENVAKYGTGAININACLIETDEDLAGGAYAESGNRQISPSLSPTGMNVPGKVAPGGYVQPSGRWPANVLHDGSEEVVASFPESTGSGPERTLQRSGGLREDGWGMNAEAADEAALRDAGTGSAARFFYSAKADADDRLGSKHPTVKPVDLMRYLCRLITPPGGTILDPFAGTGTTGEAAFYEGFNALLIERQPEYIVDIERRMKLIMSGPDERRRESIKAKKLPADDGPLFGGT